jgi:nucleoside-diphosphate-sugar epimerase
LPLRVYYKNKAIRPCVGQYGYKVIKGSSFRSFVVNVLVTGASGFVGTYLCELLQSAGYSVFPVIRNETRKLAGIASGNHRVIPDMNGTTDWSSALTGIDIVVNLAARVHVMHDNSENPLEAFRAVNVDGVMNLARQANTAGVKQLIHLSSIKVNGEQTFGKPYVANAVPAPEDAYGISKLESEQALFEFARNTHLAITVIRPPLVYGGKVKGNLDVLLKAIKKGVPLPFRLVKNKRNMVSLYNLGDLVRECIGNNKAYGQIFLVSDGQAISTADLIAYLARGIGKTDLSIPVPPALLKYALYLLGKKDMADRLLGDLEVDIRLTTQQLGWQPPFTVEQSFNKMFLDM